MATSGVYMLFKNKKLTYIGKSIDAEGRVRTHKTNGREFDYYVIVPCSMSEAEWVEIELIKRMQPIQNHVHTKRQVEQSRQKELARRARLPPKPTKEQRMVDVRNIYERTELTSDTPPVLSYPVARQLCYGFVAKLDEAIKQKTIPYALAGKRRLFLKEDIEKWRMRMFSQARR